MSPVNTFDPATLLPNLRAFMITAGLVRLPATAGDFPPMWLDPKRGIPYPGQTEGLGASEGTNKDDGRGGLVVAAYPATGIPSGPHEGFLVKKAAAIWYRSLKSPTIQSFHEQIRGLLHDQRNYSLNGLAVNQSLFSRECQRVTSNEEGFVYNCEIMFDLWAEDNTPGN